MSTASKLSYLNGTKSAIKQAIIDKGVAVADDTTFREYADKISEIETGGGSEPIDGDYLVQFIGYRGEVYQTGRYSTGDVVSFPSNPTHEGLIFQGWSSPVAVTDNQVTVTNQDLTIGAMFTTASGKTEIDIDLTNVTGTTITLQNITNVTLIEWGDGTTSTSLESHTYDSIGEYTILISGDNMALENWIVGQSPELVICWCVEIRLSNITSIGDFALAICFSLISITIPNGVTSIGDGAFGYCSSLTSITIPDGVTNIGESAFESCYSLVSITIPNSITSISTRSFKSCNSLTSITIPNGVTSIDDEAFRSCISLTSITVPNGVTSINRSAFDYCASLTSITILNGVTSIGDYAFNSCSSLISITIPNSVTSIGEEAFSDCRSLTSITIPNGVTSIDDEAFKFCYSLKSIILSNGVTSIGIYAFSDCHSIVEYDFTAYTSIDTVPTLSNTGAFTNINAICKMYFRDQSTLDNFANATNWSTFTDYMYVREVV